MGRAIMKLLSVSASLVVACLVLTSLVAPSLCRAQAALSLPHTTTFSFVSPLQQATYLIDLGSMPTRPVLIVEASSDLAHPDVQIELVFANYQISGGPGACPGPSTYFIGPTVVGANSHEHLLYNCDPRPGAFDNETAEVLVRVTNFGSGPLPAPIDIVIRAETRVPTATLSTAVEMNLSPQTVSLWPKKDTVLYGWDPVTSNGAGYYLWAGMDYNVLGIPPIVSVFRSRLNSLLAFDVAQTLPFNAQVTNADLTLWAWELANGGGTVLLYETGSDASGQSWAEGNADGAGAEFVGATSSSTAANWNYRRTSSFPWLTPGGDTTGTLLQSRSVTTTGYHTFSSSNLDAAVQGMVDSGEDDDGFILFGPYSIFLSADTGIRFASGDYPTSQYRPVLLIDYVPTAPYADGILSTGAVSFIGEGEDFRWIYDLDDDDVLETDIGGICTAIDDEGQVLFLPYTYEYEGSPGYTGIDCCTWQIDSPQTGTTGTGQALFFHNLDPSNPANLPPDSDGDGIRDNCDNCLQVPNGPLLGSCVAGSTVGGTCHSNLDCGPGETCNLSQEDTNEDFAGDACPEPGFAAGLAMGLLSLAMRRRQLGNRRVRSRGAV